MKDIKHILKDLKNVREAAPSGSFRTNARIRILNTVSFGGLRLPWYRKPRVWGYTFGSALATVALSIGTGYAAQSSLPNSTLYPMKVLSEHLAMTLAPTKQLKNNIAGTIISHRIDEMEQVQKNGSVQELNNSINHFNQDVHELEQQEGVSRDHINKTISKHKTFINSLIKHNDREDVTSQNIDVSPTETPHSPEKGEHEDNEHLPSVAPTAPTVIPRAEIKIPDVEGEPITPHDD